MTRLRIVIPVLDEGEGLSATLLALAPLRARGAEVVVADGGSTDATWAIACAHADRVLAAPRGRASQMNAGAADCAADALMFLHADTRLPPDADVLVAQALAQGHAWGRFDVRIAGAHPLLRVVETLMNLRSRLTGIATGDQALFVRADAFRAAGGFAGIPLMEDVEICKRLKQQGPPACLRARVTTSARRWEKAGVLRTIALMWWLRLRWFLGADPAALARAYGYAPRPAPARAAVAVLAKAPVAGYAKTRLAPALGARAAARAQRRFTRAAVAAALQARLGPVRLWCAPDAAHRFFRVLARQDFIELHAQGEGDLGDRLARAMHQHFESTPTLPLLLIGTDCPLLGPGHLQRAAAALASHDAVLIPAEDGGYVLLGLARPLPQAFERIPWSTDAVAAQTQERLAASGARVQVLPALWDVDEPADALRLRRILALPEEALS
jgi:rSAM/selenodomain-associated transferase 2/rSAM/selenodomain-associated transferase 1